jgi:hypothetical protein
MLSSYSEDILGTDSQNNDTDFDGLLDGWEVSNGYNPLVSDDSVPPEIDSPADIPYYVGDTGHSITWNPTDEHPVRYEILRNGVSIRTGGWNSTIEIISISVDGLGIGSWNYTIIVTDSGGNSATDTVFVIVSESSTTPITTTTTETTTTTTTETSTTSTTNTTTPIADEFDLIQYLVNNPIILTAIIAASATIIAAFITIIPPLIKLRKDGT